MRIVASVCVEYLCTCNEIEQRSFHGSCLNHNSNRVPLLRMKEIFVNVTEKHAQRTPEERYAMVGDVLLPNSCIDVSIDLIKVCSNLLCRSW